MTENSDFSILIIDDEIDIVEPLTIYLTNKKYNVTSFTDPRKALVDLKTNIYDLIFTDLKMPHVKGLDIVKAVRQRNVDTKIVIFTGYASVDASIEALKLRVYDFIRKPFVLQDIERVAIHARDQLTLEREKAALNKYIDQMYSNISILCDVSTILYQVSDIDTALEMVLYTMTDSIGVKQAALLVKEPDRNQFIIQSSKGLNTVLDSKFKFSDQDLINGTPIATEQPTIIELDGTGIAIGDSVIDSSHQLDKCILIPVRFRDELCGFIGIFKLDDSGPLSLDDKLKLVSILATQVAPIMFSVIKGDRESVALRSIDKANMDMIEAKMSTARSLKSVISFGLLKISNLWGFSQPDLLEQFLTGLKEVVQDEAGIGADHIWLTVDTLLLILPGIDQVTAEFICLKLKRKIEEYSNRFNQSEELSVNHTLVFFPEEGDSVSEILLNLWNKFLIERKKLVS